MNEQQISIAVNTGRKLFAPGSNVTGIDGGDIEGVFLLKQLLLQLSNGSLRLVRSELLEKHPEPPKPEEPLEPPANETH